MRPADRPIFVSSRRSSIAHLLARDTMAASTRVVLGVFALAALVTYNLLSMMHGHATASALGHHMDSHPLNLNNRDDAFSFEPHVVAEAGARISAPPAPAALDRDLDPPSGPASDPPGDPPPPAKPRRAKGGNGKFHVLLTANDSQYQRWQSRIMYYHYEKLRAAHPDSALGGFTRILHSGHPDPLMHEIPTVIVDPLPPSIGDDGYVVLHRPYAFVQWLEKHADDIEEEYVLMSEPDHLHVKPMPLLANKERAAAFPFSYVTPNDAKYRGIVRRFNAAGAPPEDFAPIGNSPVMISVDQLREVVPVWHDLAVRMKKDEEANAAFGWVVEMWAYSIASAQVGVRYDLHPEMMLQPPWDTGMEIKGKEAYIIHYTYGDDYDQKGRFTNGKVGWWHFDKRDYSAVAPRKGQITPPPEGTNAVVRRLVEMINEGIDALPNWGV